MTENQLVKKLRIKPTNRVLLVNAPNAYTEQLEPLPREVQIDFQPNGQYDVVQLFVINRKELESDLKWLTNHLSESTVFWITYPKKSSGIPSDLGMMQSWDETDKYGFQGVAAAAIDSTWTALRFRPVNQVKQSAVRNAAIQNNEFGEFIDVENKTVKLPPHLRAALQPHSSALHFFEQLSYTNKKEYVVWNLTAKQEKTKEERLQKTVEKLLAGKKNPSEK